jgi:hypothetical protein
MPPRFIAHANATYILSVAGQIRWEEPEAYLSLAAVQVVFQAKCMAKN